MSLKECVLDGHAAPGLVGVVPLFGTEGGTTFVDRLLHTSATCHLPCQQPNIHKLTEPAHSGRSGALLTAPECQRIGQRLVSAGLGHPGGVRESVGDLGRVVGVASE